MTLTFISLPPLAASASLGVARAILICLATAASVQAEDTPVIRARSLVDRFEQADAEQVQVAARQLRTFLDAHPDDVQALIVAARIGWLTELRAPVVMSQGKQEPPDPAAAYKPLQDLLDRALNLEPANAEASYWKARLYGVTVPVRAKEWLDYQPIDIDQAIRFARRAVDLAPQDVAYREALAQYLVIHQEPKAAIDVLKDVRQGRHPLYVLLSDFESIPIPEGAAFDRMFSTALAQTSSANGNIPADYASVRVRAYVVAIPVAEVAAFYRRHWPAFRLGKGDSFGSDRTSIVQYSFYLRPSPSGWVVQTRLPKKIPKEGMSFGIAEIRNAPPEAIRRLPIAAGDVYCTVVLANMRVVPP